MQINEARDWWRANRDRVIASLPLTIDGVTYGHRFPATFEEWLDRPGLSPSLSDAYIFSRIRRLQKALGVVEASPEPEPEKPGHPLLPVIQSFLSTPPHSDQDLSDLFDLLAQLEPEDKRKLWDWLGDNAPNIKRWLVAAGSKHRRAA